MFLLKTQRFLWVSLYFFKHLFVCMGVHLPQYVFGRYMTTVGNWFSPTMGSGVLNLDNQPLLRVTLLAEPSHWLLLGYINL